jgi:hypothetical protein
VDRLDAALDGLLHLMDRQVVDHEGLMVCKCDDLEVTETPDGRYVVTALLVGAPVWLPRVSRWLDERWGQLGSAQEDRRRPHRIDLDEIERVTQEIRLKGGRTGVLRRAPEPDTTVRRLVGDLLGARVIGPADEQLGEVLDVRLEPDREHGGAGLTITSLLVGQGRLGSYLGYDRQGDQGPWLVNRVVRWLHRHSGMVAARDIDHIDWERRRVRVRSGLAPLTHAGTTGEPERGP